MENIYHIWENDILRGDTQGLKLRSIKKKYISG